MAKIKKTKIEDLIPDDLNFNKGTEFGQSIIEKSLRSFGAGRSILLDKNNRIIAGNKTTEGFANAGMEDVIIVETTGNELVAVKRNDIDLDSKEGRELALADNATSAANLDWDTEAIQHAQESYGIDPPEWGVNIEFGEEEEPENEVNEDGFNPPTEVETDIKPGDIYELRKGDICHRLMCGDATDLCAVTSLMGGKVADLIVTDPPYNVDYSSKNKTLNDWEEKNPGKHKANRVQTDIVNDRMENAAFASFLRDVYIRFADITKPGGAIYVFHAASESVNFITGLTNAGFLFKQCLVWVKNNIVLCRQDYQWQHEPILYGWKDGAPHYFIDDRTNRTVFEDKINFDAMNKKELLAFCKELQNTNEYPSSVIHEDKPLVNAEHPTMKPVKLVGRLIRNSSRKGETVIDFFLGSGTTMVASHQLERNCYGLELTPQYCQVILDRMRLLDPEIVVTKL